MARTRMFNPSFFLNEDLAGLDATTRLLFIGLWCLADREGRLEDRPHKIRVQIFPYEKPDVDAFLSDLARAGFIQRYRADGGDYIQVTNFLKYQKVHPREKPSTFPPPPQIERKEELGDDNDAPEVSRKAKKPTPREAQEVETYPSAFEEFWETYPRKQDKRKTFRCWKTRLKEKTKPEEMIAAARNYAQACQGKDPQYIKMPTTFLGPDKPFEEFVAGIPQVAKTGAPTMNKNVEAALALARKAEEEEVAQHDQKGNDDLPGVDSGELGQPF
jgi:hypothetical protein